MRTVRAPILVIALTFVTACARSIQSNEPQTTSLLLMLLTFSSQKQIYVANNLTPTISKFSFNPASDEITGTGETTISAIPIGLAVDPTGSHLYAAVTGNNTVTAFAIGPNEISSLSATATGSSPSDVTISSNGRFVYVPNRLGNTVNIYARSSSTGLLTDLGTTATGTAPVSIAIDPTGQFAFVPNFGSNTASAFTINQTTGALTANGTVATGSSPNHLLVHSSGRFAYVCNNASNNVTQLLINTSTGVLTANGTIAAGTTPSRMGFDYSGSFLYVANAASNNISIYRIDQSTGTLTAIGSAAAGSSPRRIAVGTAGLLVSSFGTNSLLRFSMDSDGGLRERSNTGAGSGPIGVASTP
ncbi:MAG: beta-propeller fold lactonase family protein [Leptospirales bacterium]|nr:beta-propeller fold lactonase family protein [Leptospirales bacterium]